MEELKVTDPETKKFKQTWGHLPFWADTPENFKARVKREEERINLSLDN